MSGKGGRPKKRSNHYLTENEKEVIWQLHYDLNISNAEIVKLYKMTEEGIRTLIRRFDARKTPESPPRPGSRLNRDVRLKWAHEFKSFQKKDWRRVLFSDESRFSQFYDGTQFCYRRSNEQDLPDAVHYIQLRFGVGTMAWGAFSYYGVSNLQFVSNGITSEVYQQILNENLIPLLNQHVDKQFIFQQDNAPSHKSRSTMQYFQDNQISIIWWPPYSPDLNPIENLWGIIKRKMSLINIQNKSILEQVIQHEWQNIDIKILQVLIDSMIIRCQQVIESDGETIRY